MLLRLVAAWVLLALGCVAASAHATLVRSEPADGAILDQAPQRLVLTFNEPVSPLVLRLIAADGTATPLDGVTLADQTVTVDLPPALGDGGYVASWRVVSGDGHPIGGSVVFSVGDAGAAAARPADDAPDRPLEAAIVVVRTLVYAGLFVGVGGMFFAAFLAAPPKAAMRAIVAALAITPVALFISIGLQGLDALGLTIGSIAEAPPWRAGFATSYGTAALIAVFAALAALVGLGAQPRARKALAALSLAALGVAFAATGHASAAAPQWLMRPAVFIHTTGVAVWAGALLPLAFLLLGRDDGHGAAALARFSRVIPYAVVPLVAAGIVLAVIQVGTPEALVNTAYGLVLLAKGALLVAPLCPRGGEPPVADAAGARRRHRRDPPPCRLGRRRGRARRRDPRRRRPVALHAAAPFARRGDRAAGPRPHPQRQGHGHGHHHAGPRRAGDGVGGALGA